MAFKMNEKYWRIADEIYDNGRYLRVIVHKYPSKTARDSDINSFDKLAKPYYIADDENNKLYTDSKNYKTLDELKTWLYKTLPCILEGVELLRDEQGFILLDANEYLLIKGKKTKIDQRKSFFNTAEAA